MCAAGAPPGEAFGAHGFVRSATERDDGAVQSVACSEMVVVQELQVGAKDSEHHVQHLLVFEDDLGQRCVTSRQAVEERMIGQVVQDVPLAIHLWRRTGGDEESTRVRLSSPSERTRDLECEEPPQTVPK